MAYKVTWDQWFRCGPYGDDVDFKERWFVFDTLQGAERFKADLVSGRFTGYTDCRVYDHEVTIAPLT